MLIQFRLCCDNKRNKLHATGLADPYVKGQIGSYRFRTKIQKKTLTPKWQEEFKIPIVTWESPNMLVLELRDKDHFVDDILGFVSENFFASLLNTSKSWS